MQIDITKLLSNYVSVINIDNSVTIDEKFIEDVRLSRLVNLKFTGKIRFNEEDMLLLTGVLSGTMILKDDVTLEDVEYDFTTDLEEILENNQKILDITDILWQNILVEIPSKVHGTDEDVTLSGDGWRVISEDAYNKEKNTQNPFSELSELLEKKEDR